MYTTRQIRQVSPAEKWDSSNCLLSHSLSLLERRAFHSFSAQRQNLLFSSWPPHAWGGWTAAVSPGMWWCPCFTPEVAKQERGRRLQCHPVLPCIPYDHSPLLRGNLPERQLSQNCGIYTAFFSTGSLLSTKMWGDIQWHFCRAFVFPTQTFIFSEILGINF